MACTETEQIVGFGLVVAAVVVDLELPSHLQPALVVAECLLRFEVEFAAVDVVDLSSHLEPELVVAESWQRLEVEFAAAFLLLFLSDRMLILSVFFSTIFCIDRP